MICDWFQSFDGWGLFFLLLDPPFLQSLILHTLEDSENNVVDPEEAFKSFFDNFDSGLIRGTHLSYKALIYDVDCWLLKGPKEGNDWTKTLRIIFSTIKVGENIIVDILIEKLKSSKLLDLAADVVAANIDEERKMDVE